MSFIERDIQNIIFETKPCFQICWGNSFSFFFSMLHYLQPSCSRIFIAESRFNKQEHVEDFKDISSCRLKRKILHFRDDLSFL